MTKYHSFFPPLLPPPLLCFFSLFKPNRTTKMFVHISVKHLSAFRTHKHSRFVVVSESDCWCCFAFCVQFHLPKMLCLLNYSICNNPLFIMFRDGVCSRPQPLSLSLFFSISSMFHFWSVPKSMPGYVSSSCSHLASQSTVRSRSVSRFI